MELLGDIFLTWVTSYMAARPDSLFAARYFRFVVRIRQYWWYG